MAILTSYTSACYLLHTLLILVYVVLVILASHHYEHNLNFPFASSTDQTIKSNIAVAVVQTFSTLYLAGLVLVTQRLALIRDLNTRQTLTAIHDKSSAWLGLGSSLFTLFEQTRVPAAVTSVLFILMYLAGVAVLHIALPASVSISAYNATVLTQESTQLARPNSLNLASDKAWDILRVYKQLPQLGLDGNRIYDVIPTIPLAVNGATVNTTSFDVTCGLVPNVTQYDVVYGSIDGPAESPIGWVFENDPGFKFSMDTSLGPTSLKTRLFRSTLPGPTDLSDPPLLPNLVVVVSTIPVVDASGHSTNTTEIKPTLIFPVVSSSNQTSNISVTSFHITACNIHTSNGTTTVSSRDGQPYDQATTQASTWSNWTIPDAPSDPLLQNISLVATAAPYGAQNVQPNSDSDIGTHYAILHDTGLLGAEDEKIYMQPDSVVDQFIMEDVGIAPWSTTNRSQQVPLSELEFSIGKVMAAIVWYSRNGNHSVMSSDDSNPPRLEDRLGEATIEVIVTRIRLDFNIVLLAIGLGVSCLLFALTFALSIHRRTHTTPPPHGDIDAAGILELTWLLGNDEHFADLQRPDRGELRKAGMFDVQVSAWAERKTERPMEDCEDSETERLSSQRRSHDQSSDALTV